VSNENFIDFNYMFEESINKMKELGREESTKYGMYVKFYCTPQPGIDS